MTRQRFGFFWPLTCNDESGMKPLTSRLLPLILLAAPLPAQYGPRTMATDMTGSELIFTTTWTLEGETYNPYSKLIRYRSGRFETLRSILPERDGTTGCYKDQPNVGLPMMTLDRTRHAFTLSVPAGDQCEGVPRAVGEIRDGAGNLVQTMPGEVAMSSNGLWARYGRNSFKVVNLESGAIEEVPELLPYNRPPGVSGLASDGTFVAAYGSGFFFMKRPGLEGEYSQIEAGFFSATIADSGNFMVGMSPWTIYGLTPKIWLFDLVTKQAVPAAWAEEGCFQPTLSADGSRMAFVSKANWSGTNPTFTLQAFVMDLTTGSLQQLTQGSAQVLEAVISGDGRTVYARREDGSIVFVEVETAKTQEVVPPTPEGVSASSPAAPGSRLSLYLPGNGTPVITLEGSALKYVGIVAQEYLLPDGISPGDHTLKLNFEGSPFRPIELSLTVRDLAPYFRYWNNIPQVWHDSSGTAVWEANPARSGEVVEVLLSGLGPVDAEGKTLLAMNWKFRHPGQEQAGPIEVLASRRSPYEGEEGLYRVKLRVPPIHDAGNGMLSCSDARDDTVASWASLAVTP